MKTLACDRCLKVKTDGDNFQPVMIYGNQIDLCEDCFKKYSELEEPYDKAIREIERARIKVLMEFVYGFRNNKKKTT